MVGESISDGDGIFRHGMKWMADSEALAYVMELQTADLVFRNNSQVPRLPSQDHPFQPHSRR
jgi:hypothetical protein